MYSSGSKSDEPYTVTLLM